MIILDVQHFGEEEDMEDPNLESEEDFPEDDESGEGSEYDEVGGEENGQSVYRSQEEVDEAIEKRLARERRRLAKTLGVNKLEEASGYLKAGRAVTSASGLSAAEVANRLSGYRKTQQGGAPQQSQTGGNQAMPDETSERLQNIESLIAEERSEKVRSQQEAEAKQEFGKLYDEYQEDILEKAEDLGLPVVDAAAIVLRPKLKDHIATQQREKQALKGKRKVESSEGSPSKGDDVTSKLSPQQKRVAQKMNMSYKDYYAQLKELGEVE